MRAIIVLASLVIALSALLPGCKSVPPKPIVVTPSSSILGVDVDFMVKGLFYSRVLVGAYFQRESLHGRLASIPELVSSNWVNDSRAYLLNPEPGTYYLVAVAFAEKMPRVGASTSFGSGVGGSLSTGGSGQMTVVLAEEMILRTMTTIGPASVEFMGALRIEMGGRINAKTSYQDDLQKQLAESIRPGVTSATGFSGRMTRLSLSDLEKSSITRTASDRKKFSSNAARDFENSPWLEIVRRELEPR